MTYHIVQIYEDFTVEVIVDFFENGKKVKRKKYVFNYGTTHDRIRKYLDKENG